MPQAKKRPSKAAKAAKKILEDSKLLAVSKAETDATADQTFKPGDSAVKTAAAIKPRPNKKRG
jgi:hypothetical protein